ncbi:MULTISPECIES: zf-HC2 domain-containing protein [Sorangium]|uniref:Zf-HC2 domain-containing protein n=1 Tax=Sorangium atrum TaxID=2995308 RepID=A0ABT5BYN6_9BACT|nr:zf-HC2 domain-containing protein [Sorangium aterium]MDC0679265.1 zf-HC2 domain-containing protein [Sorangium aterium]
MAGCNREWFENISAWHDDEVTPEDAARIEAHVAGCGPCRRAAEVLGGVRRALVAKADGEVPERLRDRAEAAARNARARRRGPWAITAALAAVAAAAALLVGSPSRGVSAAMADELVSHHVRGFARERPCDFESSDPGAVAGWLEGKLGYAVTVPPVSGARLLGARLCQIGGTRTAALMYESGDKPLTVFVPPPGSGAATAARALAGRSVGCTQGPLGNAICARSVEQPVLAVAEVDAAALAPALFGR